MIIDMTRGMKEPQPKDGDRRMKKCFAWFPTRLSWRKWVWLESYHCEQQFVRAWGQGDYWYTVDRFII